MTDTVNVPREPTDAMIEAGNLALSPWVAPAMNSGEAYRAMLAAAPKAGPRNSRGPDSDELLVALEGIVHFSDGFETYGKQTTLGRALAQWINEARLLIAKHKGPQS